MRAHVMLEPEQFASIVAEARRTGLSRSELVRRAIDGTYRPEARRRLAGFDVGFGIWRAPDAAVAGRRDGAR